MKKSFIIKNKNTNLLEFEYQKERIEEIGDIFKFEIKNINYEYEYLFPISLELTNNFGLSKWNYEMKFPKNR